MSDDDAVTWDASRAAGELVEFAENDVERFPTGYSLDRTCGMIGPGELGLLWARSSTGKSTWILNVISRSGWVPTVVFNMEMTARRQLEWLTGITQQLNVPARDVEDVLRRPADSRYRIVRDALDSMPLYFPWLHFVNPSKAPKVSDLQRIFDRIWDRTDVRPRRVFIDHLTLMEGARDYEGVSRTAAQLHTWAMNDGLSVVAVQQTGRGGNDKQRNDGHLPVTLSSGVYAGEHDADFIWGLYRPEKDPKYRQHGVDETPSHLRGITRLQVVKNRPFGELEEVGIQLEYERHSRRLYEVGAYWNPPEPVQTESGDDARTNP